MTPESPIPSAATAAPPPAPPTAAPPSNVAAPAQPAQDAPTPDSGVAVSTEGAQPHPQSPAALAEQRVQAARNRLREVQAGTYGTPSDEGAQTEVSDQQEPIAPIEDPANAQPTAPIEAVDSDYADPSTPITEDDLRKRYHVPAKLAPELAGRLAAAQELTEGVTQIGGTEGLKFSRDFNPLLWKTEPTDADAEAAFDALVLPEKGGARKLVTKMANHFVATALYDPTHGPGFASDLIREEWGVQPDGKTAYDLPFVDSLLQAHKSWGVGPDGKPIDVASLSTLVQSLQKNGITVDHAAKLFRANKLGIVNNEYLDAELSDHPEEPERELTEREKEAIARADAAEAKLRETETSTEQKEAERKAEHERNVGVYRTQATGWLRQYVLAKVMPAATRANWAAKPGEKVSPGKKTLGRLTSTTINHEIMHGETKPQWDALMTMIDEGEAFDRSGNPTPRFLQAAQPLQNTALALHGEFIRDLGPELKFTSANSRNARLVNENGRNGQPPDQQPPPIAQPRPAAQEESYEEGIRRIRATHQARVRAAQQQPGTLR